MAQLTTAAGPRSALRTVPSNASPPAVPGPRRPSPRRAGPPLRTSPAAWAIPMLAALHPVLTLAGVFSFPTDNRALLEPAGESRFFAPTPGRTWEAGQFGCVRTEGWQMHEGIDILSVHRDRRGEPLDEVRAAAAGAIAYINRKAGLSNYGIYVVLRHEIEGLEVYTLYAHLREVRDGLAPGSPVRSGETLGIMGRTANTASSISRERAHVHFEIDLVINDRFSAWLKASDPKARDDHGPWNGRNLLGINPVDLLRPDTDTPGPEAPGFSLLSYLRTRPELFRVLVPETSFPWLRRYPRLIRRNPIAESEGIVAYEVSFDFNGVPFRLIPRARRELASPLSGPRLLAVDEAVYRRHPCRKLVVKRGSVWTLTARGRELLSLLVF